MKSIRYLLLIILINVLFPLQAKSTDELLGSIVLIYSDSGTSIVGGSGFFIHEDGLLVSAYHVIEGAKKIHIKTQKGMFNAEVRSYDAKRDLVLLKVKANDKTKFDFIQLNKEYRPTVGDVGYVIGNPDYKEKFSNEVKFPKSGLLQSSKWSMGINGKTEYIFSDIDLNLIVVDGTLNHGMSGAPIIVNGKAVGVFSGSEENSGSGLGWGIPVMYLDGLEDAKMNAPSLALLKPSSKPLKLLKFAKNENSKEVFRDYLHLEQSKKMVENGRFAYQNMKHLVSICVEAIKSDDIKKFESFGCSKIVTAIDSAYKNYSIIMKIFLEQFFSLGKKLDEFSDNKTSYLTMPYVKSGFIKVMENNLTDMNGKKIARLGRKVEDANKRVAKNDLELKSYYKSENFSLFEHNNENYTELNNTDRKTYILQYQDYSEMIVELLKSQILTMNIVYKLAEKISYAALKLSEIMNFTPNYDDINKSIAELDISKLERAYYLGNLGGTVSFAENILKFCASDRSGLSSHQVVDIENLSIRWKSENYILVKRLMNEADLDYASMHSSLMTQLNEFSDAEASGHILQKMCNDLANGDVSSEIVSGILDIKQSAPDGYEAIMGIPVERNNENFWMILVKSFYGKKAGDNYLAGLSNILDGMDSDIQHLLDAIIYKWIDYEFRSCSYYFEDNSNRYLERLKRWESNNADYINQTNSGISKFFKHNPNDISRDYYTEGLDSLELEISQLLHLVTKKLGLKAKDKRTYCNALTLYLDEDVLDITNIRAVMLGNKDPFINLVH